MLIANTFRLGLCRVETRIHVRALVCQAAPYRTVTTFSVVAIDHQTGRATPQVMATNELLKATELTTRDLFALNLTARQEKRPLQQTLAALISRPSGSIPPQAMPESDRDQDDRNNRSADNNLIASLGSVRAVVTPRSIFVLDAHLAPVQDLARELAVVYPSNRPHATVFLEFVLADMVESYQRRLRIFQPIADNYLHKAHGDIDGDTNVSNQSFPLKDALQSFELEIQQSFDCLTNAGEGMDEILLTLYARQLANISVQVKYLLKRLQSKQEFVTLALSSYRNRMVKMNVRINIATLSMAFGMFMTSFYGMNVPNGFEENLYIFNMVTAASVVGGTLIASTSLGYLSGPQVSDQAAMRLQEQENLASALSDMTALDYAMKVARRSGGLNRERFRQLLKKGRPSKHASRQEVDLLFQIFDRNADGYLRSDDFAEEKKKALPEK